MATPNYEMDKLYDSFGLQRMKTSYMDDNENSPQDRLALVCNLFGSNPEHSKRLYEYASKHWLSLSSPLLGYKPDKKLSYPISCYLTYVEDTIEGLIGTLSETNHMSVCGGGVAVKMNVRPIGDKSMGVITHCKTYDSCVMAYKQGTRRGSYAMYLDINHPEILNFIDMRKPTGDYNLRCLNINIAVCISDKFMKLIEACTGNPSVDDSWDLIDPYNNKVKETVSAKLIWQKLLENRMETGEPYILFTDTCNRGMNKWQREKGFKIQQSNLCTEVIVPTDANRSSLCCLASLNADYYDDWKDNEQFIGDTLEMLDNVLSEFKLKSMKNDLSKAQFGRVMDSVDKERNVGIGLLGFHSYLQSKGISMESEEARVINENMFKWIRETSDKYNHILGQQRGSPADIAESGNRFAYTLAVAPNATTSIIMGNTSPSIEPFRANVYRQDTSMGTGFNKNKHLEKIFDNKEFGKALRSKIWSSIINNDGSVQHLPDYVLTKKEKEVFKTFSEIDQKKLVVLAADRQKYIDQGQSLTLTFEPDHSLKDIHDTHLLAWRLGCKTMYYLRSMKISRADRLAVDDVNFMSCKGCEA